MLQFAGEGIGNSETYPCHRYLILNDDSEKVGSVLFIIRERELGVGIMFSKGVNRNYQIKYLKDVIALVESNLIDFEKPYDKIDYDIDHLDLGLTINEIKNIK